MLLGMLTLSPQLFAVAVDVYPLLSILQASRHRVLPTSGSDKLDSHATDTAFSVLCNTWTAPSLLRRSASFLPPTRLLSSPSFDKQEIEGGRRPDLVPDSRDVEVPFSSTGVDNGSVPA